MSYRQVLEFAASLEQLGTVRDVTIGGAVAIILLAEPIHTDDLAFFVHLAHAGVLVDLGPLSLSAEAAGATVEGEYLRFGAAKFQFIVAATALVHEAMAHAEAINAFGVGTRVVSPEYVTALKLAAFRPKDRVHILHLLRTARRPVDVPALEVVLGRHGLLERWRSLVKEVQP